MVSAVQDLNTRPQDFKGDLACIFAGYYGFNINISFTFQAVKNLSAYPTYLRFGLLYKFFGDFRVNLGINSFSQRISKIYGNRKF